MRYYTESDFTDKEWKYVEFTPFLFIYSIAFADGKVDREETNALFSILVDANDGGCKSSLINYTLQTVSSEDPNQLRADCIRLITQKTSRGNLQYHEWLCVAAEALKGVLTKEDYELYVNELIDLGIKVSRASKSTFFSQSNIGILEKNFLKTAVNIFGIKKQIPDN